MVLLLKFLCFFCIVTVTSYDTCNFISANVVNFVFA